MHRKPHAAALVGILILVSCSESSVRQPSVAIGLSRFEYVDQSRQNWTGDGPRPLTTYVWYPAADGTEMAEIGIPPSQPVFQGGYAARDAHIRSPGIERPLIVMSHGTGGAGMQMMWLGWRLAEQGYIAAAVDHHGNTAAEPEYDPRGFRLIWERPQDLSRVIDQLLAEPRLAGSIDETNIAAVGYSLGGYTAISLAGGQIDLDQFAAFCQSDLRDATCEPQTEFPEAYELFEELARSDSRIQTSVDSHKTSFRDERVSLVVALAPALGAAFTETSLNVIDIPVRVVTAGADAVAPESTNSGLIAEGIPGARLDVIHPTAGHYVFLSTCTGKGRLFVPVCKDPVGVDRNTVHEATARLVLDELETHTGEPRTDRP